MENNQKTIKNKTLLLASQSPRRRDLMQKLNVTFKTTSPSFEEKLDSNDYSDRKIQALSLQKALSVLNEQKPQNCLIISADTVVVLDEKILGKPQNAQHAKEMLRALSAKKHYVVTAITIIDSDTKKEFFDITKTYVTFCDLSNEQIEKYILDKKPLDKAGAYGIQEMNTDYIKSVEGDLENVIGLSTKSLRNLLIQAGYEFN